jgi:LuxR family maltose regulon positive regulatory protein
VEQLRADADEAVRRFAAVNIVTPIGALLQGLACVLSSDVEGADVCFEEAANIGSEVAGHEVRAEALCERALLAMARGDWGRAEALAADASAVLRRARIEDCLVSAVCARAAMHRGDVQAARQELVRAQRLRHLLTYAQPHVAVQARIQLIHVQLVLADIAGAKTLMREVDEVLRHRPGLGALADEAQALHSSLATKRGPSSPGASALTAAELRLLPMLSTHLSTPEIAGELVLSRHTVRAQTTSIYRKLGASSRSQAVTRSRELGLLDT